MTALLLILAALTAVVILGALRALWILATGGEL